MKINAKVNFPETAELLLIENYFPSEMVKKINEIFDIPLDQWDNDPAFAHNPGRYSFSKDKQILNEIDEFSKNMEQHISESINADVSYIGKSLWLDTPGYIIPPHLDLPNNPDVAVQIYMGDKNTWEMLGTCFYTNSKSIFEMHYWMNTGYICVHPDKILHGLKHTIQTQFVRNSVYMRYRIK